MAGSGMLSTQALSFEQLLDNLVAYGQNKPDGLTWQDWFKYSDGQIVAEWIAGLATFRAYHEAMRVRESQLDQAQIPSSVFNLAFNKGLLIPPAMGCEILLTLTVPNLKSIDEGDLVARLGSYELYSLDSKTINGADQTLRVVAGHLNEFTATVPGMKAFQTYKYTVKDTFFSQQLEEFAIDGVKQTLLTDPDYLNDVTNNFLLRRVMPNQSRIYAGNNIIGTYDAAAALVTYRVLSYDTDLSQQLENTPSLLIDGTLQGFEVTLLPSYDPDKEEVREIARFYPIDGRCVTDNDYAVITRKNFGGIIVDCYSVNTDPDQHIYILKDVSFGTGDAEANYLQRITKLIDSKRTLGMPVYYHLAEMADGKTFITSLKVPVADYTNDLVDQANAFLKNYVFKYRRAAETHTTTSVAIALSAHFGIQFYPNANDTISIASTEFFKDFHVNVISF